MKSESTVQPQPILALGNGKHHFNYNIHIGERDSQALYEYDTVEIHEPTYDAIVLAIIRDKISESQEMAMINKYNAYKAGIGGDLESVSEYEEFLRWVAEIKLIVRKSLGI